MSDLISTNQNGAMYWRTESTQKPPKQACFVDECSAADILKAAYAQTATVWTGDFHNAKQVLAAMKKRVRQTKKAKQQPSVKDGAADAKDIQAIFHAHRMQQAQQSRILNMLAVEVRPGLVLEMARAPDIRAALLDVYDSANDEPFLLPLNQLLGFIGAHEWHKKGIEIPKLGARLYIPFGVFSPIRGEYLDLIADAPIADHVQTAFDIGTGSGVIAALLAKRGIRKVIATDTNPKAIACARDNLGRLKLDQSVFIEAVDLFPSGCADLIVCNPPWLPAKPTSAIETALYDPDHAMLKGFLNGVSAHLNPNGEVWLIISDLAEHLHLRGQGELEQYFQMASLSVIDVLKTRPVHHKAADNSDSLAFARSKETTYLYRLKAQPRPSKS